MVDFNLSFVSSFEYAGLFLEFLDVDRKNQFYIQYNFK